MWKTLTYLAIPLLALVLVGTASAKLLVHWRLDEGSGTTAYDSTGNGYDGTFVGTPQWVAGHLSAGALHFDGDAAASSVVHSLGAATSWPVGSVAVWVKVDSLGQDQYSSVFTNHYPNSAGIQIDVDGGNPGNYRVNPSGLIFGPVTTDWIHLTLAFDNTSANLYYNGTLATNGTLTATNTTFNQFAIGLNRNAANWLAATIDELRVYDHPLSEVEVLSAMSGEPWPYAYGPTPADGAMHLATWVSLSWKPGDFAASHDVYLGDDFDGVNDGMHESETFRGNQTTTGFLAGFPGFVYPDGLVPGTTYYWRIDEVNDAEPNSPWKGPVWSFSIPPRTAYNPSPADGAEAVGPDNVTLTWTAGFGAKLHHVYFGTNLDDVEAGAPGTYKGPAGVARFVAGKLESEKVYYWRVDEFDGAATYKGDIWAFTTPGAVGKPQPANRATGVQMTTKLSWTAAANATSHKVYFGTDRDAVKNATTASPEYKGSKALGDETLDPGKLAWHTSYYWRVDAVYSTGEVKGIVWAFTTADFLLVDDFESYNDIDPPDPASNRIFDSWIDGFGTTDNGALVGNDMPPYAEQTIVHSGTQSMPYSYDNNLKTSEATMTLVYPRDWTEEGVGQLSLWFRGASANSAERMFVALNGSAVVYHADPAVTQKGGWNQWVIDLQAFQGVSLTNVNTITIGFGTKGSPAAGGSGKMYFDDIRLYRP